MPQSGGMSERYRLADELVIEFVGAGRTTAPPRGDLDATLEPAPKADRLLPLIHAAEHAARDPAVTCHADDQLAADEGALFAAAQQMPRRGI